MSHPRIDLREPSAAGAFGARLEGALPMPLSASATPIAREAASPRRWLARGVRLVCSAAVAVALMALVPIALVAVEGDYLARVAYGPTWNVTTRVDAARTLRPFGLPSDPSITPAQAGAALNRLQPPRVTVPGFVAIAPAAPPILPWRETPLTPDMFRTARSNFYDGTSSDVLEAVAKGFSPRELEYLRTLAEAPVWRDFDLVARAPAVDAVGGAFEIPFGEGAFPEQRPAPSYRESRELAYAAVSRAAYYMSQGRRDDAERTLRSIVSFGLSYIDNGTTRLEELIGTMEVGIGHDALHRFYVIQHDPRADSPALQPPVRAARGVSAAPRFAPLPTGEARRLMLARMNDPSVPLGERFESLRSLPAMSCTNVRELMFGPRADVTDALEKARHTLARFPSEQALVDLETRLPPETRVYPSTGPVQSLAVSAASVAGTVLRNPRLVACTRMISWRW